MTSLDTLEKSREDSQPIECYRFTIGSTVYLFTSSVDDLTIDGDEYRAIAIGRSNLVQGSDQDQRVLTVSMPAAEDLPSLYRLSLPGERCTMQLFRYQRNESPAFDTAVLLYSGSLQSVKYTADGTVAELAILSIESALAQNVPRFTFMAQCNNFLYDDVCGADPAAHNHIGTVTAVTGRTITVSGSGASSHDFVAGYAKPLGEVDFRQVYEVAGDVLTLDRPFNTNPLNSQMQIFAGCDHLVDGDCALVFDRVQFFTGWPWVPNTNVFVTGIIV